jgi:hypothetical protein
MFFRGRAVQMLPEPMMAYFIGDLSLSAGAPGGNRTILLVRKLEKYHDS